MSAYASSCAAPPPDVRSRLSGPAIPQRPPIRPLSGPPGELTHSTRRDLALTLRQSQLVWGGRQWGSDHFCRSHLGLDKHGERIPESRPESVAISNRDPACRRRRRGQKSCNWSSRVMLITRQTIKAGSCASTTRRPDDREPTVDRKTQQERSANWGSAQDHFLPRPRSRA